MDNAKHDTVLDVGSIKARLAKVYAEALLDAAQKQNSVIAIGDELTNIVSGVLDSAPEIEAFLSSPIIGKKTKGAALDAALPGHASDTMRGLFSVLTRNGRLNLLRGIALAYRQMLATNRRRSSVHPKPPSCRPGRHNFHLT